MTTLPWQLRWMFASCLRVLLHVILVPGTSDSLSLELHVGLSSSSSVLLSPLQQSTRSHEILVPFACSYQIVANIVGIQNITQSTWPNKILVKQRVVEHVSRRRIFSEVLFSFGKTIIWFDTGRQINHLMAGSANIKS